MIRTNEIYHRILAAPDAAARLQIYLEELVQPWKQMMDMMKQGDGGQQDDPLAGARAWAWLLPDQVEETQIVLAKLEAADAWATAEKALAQAAASFSPYRERIPFDAITGWLVLGDAARGNSYEHGYTGATDWFQPRLIGQFWDPNPDNLAHLPGLIAHEMHHLIRMRAFPFGPQTTVADYIIIEGTAESFATSLFGEDKVGFFVTEVSAGELETARRLIGKGLKASGFNAIRGYIFGDALAEQWNFQPVGGMPTYGGYAVGYHLVQAYLRRTGRTIEETTFLPAEEIVVESGYFED
jgi:uncharacterized protein YjaZ